MVAIALAKYSGWSRSLFILLAPIHSLLPTCCLFVVYIVPVFDCRLSKKNNKIVERCIPAAKGFRDVLLLFCFCCSYKIVAVTRLLLFPVPIAVYDCKNFLQSYTAMGTGNNNNLVTATIL